MFCFGVLVENPRLKSDQNHRNLGFPGSAAPKSWNNWNGPPNGGLRVVRGHRGGENFLKLYKKHFRGSYVHEKKVMCMVLLLEFSNVAYNCTKYRAKPIEILDFPDIPNRRIPNRVKMKRGGSRCLTPCELVLGECLGALLRFSMFLKNFLCFSMFFHVLFWSFGRKSEVEIRGWNPIKIIEILDFPDRWLPNREKMERPAERGLRAKRARTDANKLFKTVTLQKTF